MMLLVDINNIVNAAERCLGVSICASARRLLVTEVSGACEHAGNALDLDRMIMAIDGYEFDETAVRNAEYDADAIGASVRSEETVFWPVSCTFLVVMLDRMLRRAKFADVGDKGRRDMATVFVLIGYAIRVSRATSSAAS